MTEYTRLATRAFPKGSRKHLPLSEREWGTSRRLQLNNHECRPPCKLQHFLLATYDQQIVWDGKKKKNKREGESCHLRPLLLSVAREMRHLRKTQPPAIWQAWHLQIRLWGPSNPPTPNPQQTLMKATKTRLMFARWASWRLCRRLSCQFCARRNPHLGAAGPIQLV